MWYLRRGGDDVGSPDGSAAGDEEQGINTSSSFMSDKRAAHRNRSGRWSVFPGLRRLIFVRIDPPSTRAACRSAVWTIRSFLVFITRAKHLLEPVFNGVLVGMSQLI